MLDRLTGTEIDIADLRVDQWLCEQVRRKAETDPRATIFAMALRERIARLEEEIAAELPPRTKRKVSSSTL